MNKDEIPFLASSEDVADHLTIFKNENLLIQEA